LTSDLDCVIGKKCGIFVVKRLHFSNFLDIIWTETSHLKKILDFGWTWTEFQKIWTGSGSQNVTIRSSLEHSKGGHGSKMPVSTPEGFCIFLSDSDPVPESKICEKPNPESLLNFGSNRSLCGHRRTRREGG